MKFKQRAFPAKTQNALGFTLVELIVVVTILAILATIGFVSYSSYLTGVRDTNRLSQLVSISDGLELYRTKKDLPLPDDNIEIQVNTGTIAYQGYAGSNTLETIDFTKGGKDPKDDSYFTYYLTEDRKYFQLLGFLEEEENLSSSLRPSDTSLYEGGLIGSAQAVDYSNRLPTVYGKKLGVLTNTQNTPLQELVSSGQINLTIENTSDYVAHLSDTSSLTGSTAGNSDLVYLENTGVGGGIASSCKTLMDRNSSLKGKDGIYVIDPEGNDPFPVYCDMTTEGGGWTVVASEGTTENAQTLDTMTTVPSPNTSGIRLPLVNTSFNELGSVMRVLSVANPTTIFEDYDITVNGNFPSSLATSGYGYMYASQNGFSGGEGGASKCNLRTLVISTGPCVYPTTFPYDGESNNVILGTFSVALGLRDYSWQFESESTLYRLGWVIPGSNRVYYDAREPAYLMVR